MTANRPSFGSALLALLRDPRGDVTQDALGERLVVRGEGDLGSRGLADPNEKDLPAKSDDAKAARFASSSHTAWNSFE